MSEVDIKSTLQRAVQHQTNGQVGEAEKIYLDILKKAPDNHDALHLLGLVHLAKNELDIAISLIEKAISLQPKAASFHHNLAGINRQLGRSDEAEQGFRQAIRLKPDYAEAYQGLSEMLTFEANDPLLEEVFQQLGKRQLSDVNRSYLHFAAGKILSDTASYAQAFQHYQSGNDMAHRKFDSQAFHEEIKDSLYIFSPERLIALADAGDDNAAPIFIVGMPRSGTSLAEQILASHSKVFGAGELSVIRDLAMSAGVATKTGLAYPHYIDRFDSQKFTNLAAAYTAHTQQLSGNEQLRVVDKHPINFRFIGLIFLLFPNAKVIHTTRHPLDTCLSCYFQNFTQGQNYTFNLQAMAHFYNDYRRLMSHWTQLFGDRIYNLVYEELLDDQEQSIQDLLGYCDLEFDAACLQFHENDRLVKTASFLQVRKPIYQTSRNRWRHYSEQLKVVADIIKCPLT